MGTPNKRTVEQVRAVEESGLTPLMYLLKVMRDEAEERVVRLDAAAKAAPYVHPRLASTEVNLEATLRQRSARERSKEELLAIIAEEALGECANEENRSALDEADDTHAEDL